jgi:hypothetical protein
VTLERQGAGVRPRGPSGQKRKRSSTPCEPSKGGHALPCVKGIEVVRVKPPRRKYDIPAGVIIECGELYAVMSERDCWEAHAPGTSTS